MVNNNVFLKGKVSETMPEAVMADLVRRVVGSSMCRRSGCYGKGYTGVRANVDGTITLMLCECGRLGNSDYAVLKGEVAGIRADVDGLRRAFEKVSILQLTQLESLQEKTLSGTLSRWQKSLASKVRPALIAPKPDQVVPVKGEVKS